MTEATRRTLVRLADQCAAMADRYHHLGLHPMARVWTRQATAWQDRAARTYHGEPLPPLDSATESE
jgi:hypothetical protein